MIRVELKGKSKFKSGKNDRYTQNPGKSYLSGKKIFERQKNKINKSCIAKT